MGRTKTIHATGFSQWLIDEIFKRRICSALLGVFDWRVVLPPTEILVDNA
ncbi:MAG: hypothetical protein SQA66_16420 [Candidatus Fervidibacter sacchari]